MGKASRQKREYRTFKRKLLHDREKVAGKESRHTRQEPSPWRAAPEDKKENLQSFDSYTGLRNGLRMVAERDSEWAGLPMPLEGQRLVIEPKYPRAESLSKIGAPKEEPIPEGYRHRNLFWSWKWRSNIHIYELDGRLKWGLIPGVNHLGHDLETLRSADAWSIESESNALATLATLIRHRQYKQYLLTGMFLETSRRSNVTYAFRRLRPTVAFGNRASGELKVLCCLCLHLIAYYDGSWAGAMCPTDDVIAHLMLMRGDEPMFWRRANQHAAYRAEAGL